MGIAEAAAEVAGFLEAQGIPYAIIGGLALQRWGEPRLTRDVDVVVLVGEERFQGFVDDVLERFAPRILDARAFAFRHRVLLVRTGEGIPVDISLGIPGYEEEALGRTQLLELPSGALVRILGPEDLVIHKCVAGRPRDVEDVEAVLIRQRLRLDLDLVRRWLEAFGPLVETHDPLALFEDALARAQAALGPSR